LAAGLPAGGHSFDGFSTEDAGSSKMGKDSMFMQRGATVSSRGSIGPRLPYVAAAFVASAMGASASAAEASTPVNIRDGVYTKAQAKRGDAVYARHCAMCHLPDMGGKEPAPELAGDLFLSKWLDHTVGELFTRVQSTMPAGNPGTLTGAQYADVVALLLEANNFRAGPVELKPDPAALEKIQIKKK
jgi:mono/diheme cytochrome c family protein